MWIIVDKEDTNFFAFLVNEGQGSSSSTTGGPDKAVVRSTINLRGLPSFLSIVSINRNLCSGNCFCFFCKIFIISNLSRTLL